MLKLKIYRFLTVQTIFHEEQEQVPPKGSG